VTKGDAEQARARKKPGNTRTEPEARARIAPLKRMA
jgi:hypothetical protein